VARYVCERKTDIFQTLKRIRIERIDRIVKDAAVTAGTAKTNVTDDPMCPVQRSTNREDLVDTPIGPADGIAIRTETRLLHSAGRTDNDTRSNRKGRIWVKLDDLPLTADERSTFLEIVGSRYDSKTGEVLITTEARPNGEENVERCIEQLKQSIIAAREITSECGVERKPKDAMEPPAEIERNDDMPTSVEVWYAQAAEWCLHSRGEQGLHELKERMTNHQPFDYDAMEEMFKGKLIFPQVGKLNTQVFAF
jgi:hypothetical protein